MKTYPSCSVIVLNYFGEKVLAKTLNSLMNLDYPKDKYEIILVDNDSKDASRKLISKYAKAYPIIKPLLLDKNYGFSKGNNFAIKQSKSDYVALINNDCVATKSWLKELVTTAQKDKNIFSVNSKILLYPKYLTISFTSHPKLIPVYTWLSSSSLLDYNTKKVYLPMWKRTGKEVMNCDIELSYDAFDDSSPEITVLFNSKGYKFDKKLAIDSLIKFKNKSIRIRDFGVSDDEVRIRISIDPAKVKSRDKIQDAGIMVFQDGYARDIGALVRDSQQYYEFDNGQYDGEKEVYASCGAAVLYNKKILDEIGFLDETFFMYYEDVEICERARLMNYKSIYSPRAVVRHFHALSSKETSAFFVYHVEKGRLLHMFYNFPLRVFFREFLYMLILNAAIILRVLFSYHRFFYVVKTRKVKDNEEKFARRMQKINALGFFITQFPSLFFKRIIRSKRRHILTIEQNYQKILSGEWYLK